MIIFDTENKAQIATDEKNRILGDLAQELKLFKGENPIDTEKGIDYLAVFQGTKFIQVEVEEVLDRHRPNFKSLEVGEITYDDEIMSIPINVVFKDDEAYTTNIILSKDGITQ